VPSEWCDCKTEHTSGHLSLAPVAEVWVHGECLRPSFAWWKAFEDFCFECGKSFSSPASEECSACGGVTWAGLALLWRDHWQEIFGDRGTIRLDLQV
jgi:hypothetical protein